MNSDFIKGINKAIDAATGETGGDYTYKYHTDTTRALDRLADVIAGAAAAGMHFEVYDELPATGESNVIYLIPRESTETGNIYDEYIWTENEGFEKIGSTDVDLSGYVTTTDLATALNGYVAKETGKGLSSNDFTDALLDKLNGIAAGAEANVQSDWNEDDSSSDAFIANKPDLSEKLPSYTLGEPTVIVDTTTVSFSKDGDHDWYVSGENPLPAYPGTSDSDTTNYIYRVEFDGVSYDLFERTVVQPSIDIDPTLYSGALNCLYLGDLSFLGYPTIEEHNNNVPFALFRRNISKTTKSWILYALASSALTHTIKIYRIPFSVYLPNYSNYYLPSDPYLKSQVSIRHDSKGGVVLAGGSRATGKFATAEGAGTIASGDYSHAEGIQTVASGKTSHSEGTGNTTASGANSHAEGYSTRSSGGQSHSEGSRTIAEGANSHAEGYGTETSGKNSHSEGYYTIANHLAQHAAGRYNVADPSQAAATEYGTYAEIIGNGYSETVDDQTVEHRSNARTLDWDGNEVLSGTIEASGFGPTLAAIVAAAGGGECVTLTQAQYNALSQAEKNNGTYYYISDADVDASSTGLIDDTSTPSPDRVWSSEKTSQEIASAVGVTIDDTTTAIDKVWSSDKTDTEIDLLDTKLTNIYFPHPTGSGSFYSGISGFNPSYEYYLGDLVYFHQKQWKCIRAITNPPIDYANDWDLYFEEYSIGTMVTDFIAPWYEYISGGGIHTVYYKVGQLVIFRGQIYRCIADTNSEGWDETKWEHVDIEKLTKIDKDYVFTVDSSYESITTVNSFKMRVISGILYVYFDLSFSGTGFTGGAIGQITRTDDTQELDIGTDPIYISTPIGEGTSVGAMSESVISSIEPMGVSSHKYAYLNIDCYTAQTAPIKRVIGNIVYPLD